VPIYNGCSYYGRKEEKRMKSNDRTREWKNTEIWKAKGRARDTNTGENPGYLNQFQ